MDNHNRARERELFLFSSLFQWLNLENSQNALGSFERKNEGIFLRNVNFE